MKLRVVCSGGKSIHRLHPYTHTHALLCQRDLFSALSYAPEAIQKCILEIKSPSSWRVAASFQMQVPLPLPHKIQHLGNHLYG